MGTRHLRWVGVLLLALAAGATACGNRGTVEGTVAACKPAQAACLSPDVGQICNAQGQWATFQCGPTRQCKSGACVSGDVTCGDSDRSCLSETVGQLCTTSHTLATFTCSAGQICREGDCRDICVPGARECATDTMQRICRGDSAGWTTSECPTGSTCANGACVGSCEARSASCITDAIVRTCRSDGTGYTEQQCPPSMSCAAGKCVSNTAATCSFGQDICLDEGTALECIRDGSGYRVKDCPANTTCRNGRCQGTVCAAESTSCVGTLVADFNGIQACNEDGSGYRVTICNSGGKCLIDNDTGKHECYVAPCTAGEEICGEPGSSNRSTDYLSRCETLIDGKVGWVSYQCDAPASCKSTSPTAASCHSECSPGDQRCSTDGTAIETCNDSGTWDSSSCVTTGTNSMCVLVPTTKKPVCGDKDCRTLQTTSAIYTTRGRCSNNLIRKCGDDGRLGAAAACEDGQCLIESDGLGTCKDPTRCQHDDGWRECIASNDAYRTCMAGHWEFTLCAEGALCTNLGEGLATCGDDCVAGKTRCVDAGYQTCSSVGAWGPTQACTLGECNPLTNRCETACAPGQLRCTGEVAVASDGTSLGSRSMQRCTSTGAWGPVEACGAASSSEKLCRRSGVGEHLGCLQCVGPSVKGGNEEGAVDSRCTEDKVGYQTCQSGNVWPSTTTACTGTEHCAKQRDGSITGTCSNFGCTTGKPKRCVGYETLTTAASIEDCCANECDVAAGRCLHRRSHYDPTCTDTTSCFTGRYDSAGQAINETCCAGYCRSGQGCLRIKAKPCESVTSCSVNKLDHTNVCCGTCLTTGLCVEGGEAKHPASEYFACGASANICWGIGACSFQSSGSTSGAMFANCVE